MENFNLQLGLGFHFDPTDEELVKYFLLRKVRGEALSPDPFISDCDIYGNKSPWEIFDDERKNIWYCFTSLKKRSKRRISRVAGCGTWHGETSSKKIFDSNTNRVIGFKKTFSFKVKGKNSNWIMHEFTLADSGEESYVVCKIKKKKAKAVVHNHKSTLEEEDSGVCNTLELIGINSQMENKAIPYKKQLSEEVLLATDDKLVEEGNNTSRPLTLQYGEETHNSSSNTEEWLRYLEEFFKSDSDLPDITTDNWSSNH